jgi:hypothetical protein
MRVVSEEATVVKNAMCEPLVMNKNYPCSHAVFPQILQLRDKCSMARAVFLVYADKRNLLWELEIMRAGSPHSYRGNEGWQE